MLIGRRNGYIQVHRGYLTLPHGADKGHLYGRSSTECFLEMSTVFNIDRQRIDTLYVSVKKQVPAGALWAGIPCKGAAICDTMVGNDRIVSLAEDFTVCEWPLPNPDEGKYCYETPLAFLKPPERAGKCATCIQVAPANLHAPLLSLSLSLSLSACVCVSLSISLSVSLPLSLSLSLSHTHTHTDTHTHTHKCAGTGAHLCFAHGFACMCACTGMHALYRDIHVQRQRKGGSGHNCSC
jgi:hypothetical protein